MKEVFCVSVAGFLLKWKRNNNIDVSETKLLLFLCDFVAEENIIRSVNGSRRRTPTFETKYGKVWNAGELFSGVLFILCEFGI